eukprot:878722-Rhodomonas_salina.3
MAPAGAGLLGGKLNTSARFSSQRWHRPLLSEIGSKAERENVYTEHAGVVAVRVPGYPGKEEGTFNRLWPALGRGLSHRRKNHKQIFESPGSGQLQGST